MLAYMNDASNPQNAYPAFWAPFEIVAKGAAHPKRTLTGLKPRTAAVDIAASSSVPST